ncbi:MAG TPA: YncE family protein [Bryobacteraceae bacterium]
MRRTMTLLLIAGAALAAEGYHVLSTIKIGGQGFWDYLTLDNANRRLYVSNATRVVVVDPDAGKVVGEIPDTQGVHGIAIADTLNKGYISDGRTNDVAVFDLKTLKVLGKVAMTGTNPDAIIYEPKSERVYTFNGRSNDATAIDAKTDKIVTTIPVGGKPEFAVVDGAGHIFFNVENTSEIAEIDAANANVTRRGSIKPCEEPSGLAIDTRKGVLFSVCANKMMAVTDAKTLKVIASPEIGQGPDGAAFDPSTGEAFSSNGRDGTLTIVKEVNGKWQAVDTVKTEMFARTLTLDPKTHHIYLSSAEAGPPQGGEKKGRPSMVPDSFHLIVVGK